MAGSTTARARRAQSRSHLLEIELPPAHLLSEEQALQPVGQACDEAFELREMSVQRLTQPDQLVRRTQVLGRNESRRACE